MLELKKYFGLAFSVHFVLIAFVSVYSETRLTNGCIYLENIAKFYVEHKKKRIHFLNNFVLFEV